MMTSRVMLGRVLLSYIILPCLVLPWRRDHIFGKCTNHAGTPLKSDLKTGTDHTGGWGFLTKTENDR